MTQNRRIKSEIHSIDSKLLKKSFVIDQSSPNSTWIDKKWLKNDSKSMHQVSFQLRLVKLNQKWLKNDQNRLKIEKIKF